MISVKRIRFYTAVKCVYTSVNAGDVANHIANEHDCEASYSVKPERFLLKKRRSRKNKRWSKKPLYLKHRIHPALPEREGDRQVQKTKKLWSAKPLYPTAINR